MTDPAGSTAYTYDRRGLLLSESRASGSVLLSTSFKYDANGNRITITYPSGTNVTYAFDYANRPLTADSFDARANALNDGEAKGLIQRDSCNGTVTVHTSHDET